MRLGIFIASVALGVDNKYNLIFFKVGLGMLELNALKATIKALTERTLALRGYL